MDKIRKRVKAVMHRVAMFIDKASGGKISPNMITYTGLLAHFPIAWLIATGHFVWAAILLIIFGLFDSLDGELARLQNKTSIKGMFLDSSTDRIKEAVLYCGIVIALFNTGSRFVIVTVVVALGASLITSYINAWGEVALMSAKHVHELNKSLRIGLLGFDGRMFLIIVGLFANLLSQAVYIIAVLATITIFQRMSGTLKKL